MYVSGNKYLDFINYLYCERDKYTQYTSLGLLGAKVDFKKAIDDFVPLARRN